MWHAKASGGYARTTQEAQDNAVEIANVLYNMNWCKEAICALLGNGAGESGLNPWRWEEVTGYPLVPATTDNWGFRGYGIFQFTPATKYINSTVAAQYANKGYSPNFSNSPGNAKDGAAQCAYFADNVENDWLKQLYGYYYPDFMNIGVDITPWYYTTYPNFIDGIDNNGNPLTLNELVGVFELTYERPGASYAASSYNTRCLNAAYWMNVLPDGPTNFPYWLLFKFADWRKPK